MKGATGNTRTAPHDFVVKLLVLGDSGVGKSSLLNKFTDDTFVPHQSPTIGMDFKVKVLDVGGRRVKLQIWDTAGQERFHTITQQYYRNAMGIVLVYDATNEASFANIRNWMSQLSALGGEGADLLLLGNKAEGDPQRRAVDTARGQALAEEYGIPFLETSARSGTNVEEAFLSIADAVWRRLYGREHGVPRGFKLDGKDHEQQKQQQGGCCL